MQTHTYPDNPDTPQKKQKKDNFTILMNKGLGHLELISQSNSFKSFHDLTEQYGINNCNYLEYLQRKSIIQAKIFFRRFHQLNL